MEPPCLTAQVSALRALCSVRRAVRAFPGAPAGDESERSALENNDVRYGQALRALEAKGAAPFRVDTVGTAAALLGQRLRAESRSSPHVRRAALFALDAVEDRLLEGDRSGATPPRFEPALDAPAADRARTLEGELSELVARAPEAREDLSACLLSINASAGIHSMPADLRALEAAFDAGESSWHLNPYYAARYGDRGLRFTQSDSAWLVVAAQLPPEGTHQQLAWLSGLLVNRGMPSCLFDEHLELLGDALGAGFGPEDPRARRLLDIARRWRADKQAILPDDLRAPYAAHLDELSDTPGVGRLLAGAVVDEALGRRLAVPRLVGWLTGEHPSAAYAARLEEVLGALRSHVRT